MYRSKELLYLALIYSLQNLYNRSYLLFSSLPSLTAAILPRYLGIEL